MARLCVRIAANGRPGDPMRTQVGDVVSVVDDAHLFSHGEVNSGQYRIIDLPGIPEAALAHLAMPLFDDEGRIIRVRPRALNLSALGKGDRITMTTLDALTITRA